MLFHMNGTVGVYYPPTQPRITPQSLGIFHTERFATQALLDEVVKNRTTPNDGSRPLAVVMYPKADHNGAFAVNTPMEGLAQGYRLLYYEVGNDQELQAAMLDAAKQGPINTLYMGGHGAADRIQLGDDPYNLDEVIDLGDEAKMTKLFNHVEAWGGVVVDSCNTAQGGEHADNIAAMFSRMAPHANVAAAERPTTTYPEFAHGRLKNPGFTAPTLFFPAFGYSSPFVAHVPANVTIATGPRPSPLYPVVPLFGGAISPQTGSVVGGAYVIP